MRLFILLAFILLISICILSLLGCPGKKSDTSTQSANSGSSVPTPQPPAEPARSIAEHDMNPDLPTPVGGYRPTEERPLAPPAPPAAGSENAPTDQLSVVASLTGGDGKAIPLADGITVHVSGKFKVEITVVNKTSEKKEIVFATSQKLDIVATKSGQQVYKWSEGERFLQVVNALDLDPDQSWSHEIEVIVGTSQFELRPGKYDFSVIVTGTPELQTMAKDVTIVK